jgi:hypothetical protein
MFSVCQITPCQDMKIGQALSIVSPCRLRPRDLLQHRPQCPSVSGACLDGREEGFDIDVCRITDEGGPHATGTESGGPAKRFQQGG